MFLMFKKTKMKYGRRETNMIAFKEKAEMNNKKRFNMLVAVIPPIKYQLSCFLISKDNPIKI
jgi:hypothetical protein